MEKYLIKSNYIASDYLIVKAKSVTEALEKAKADREGKYKRNDDIEYLQFIEYDPASFEAVTLLDESEYDDFELLDEIVDCDVYSVNNPKKIKKMLKSIIQAVYRWERNK